MSAFRTSARTNPTTPSRHCVFSSYRRRGREKETHAPVRLFFFVPSPRPSITLFFDILLYVCVYIIDKYTCVEKLFFILLSSSSFPYYTYTRTCTRTIPESNVPICTYLRVLLLSKRRKPNLTYPSKRI